MILRLWRRLKVTRRIGLGPVSLVFKVERNVRITQPGIARHTQSVAMPSTQIGEIGVLSAPSSTSVSPPDALASKCAVVVGVGPGFGYAMAQTLAASRFDTVLVSRDAKRLSPLVAELCEQGRLVCAYGADATDEVSVSALFSRIRSRHGVPSLVIYSVQSFGPGAVGDIEVPAFEAAWRHNCLGAFLVGKAAAALMKPSARGSIVFVGSTSSLVGRAGHLNLAVGKFGQRALSQVMARELWPQGIHVAHVVIDADIAEESNELPGAAQSDPVEIASAILTLHLQPQTAWTSELDLRPWNESFWEHC